MFNKTSLVPKLRAPINLEIMLLSSAVTAVLCRNFLVLNPADPAVHIYQILLAGVVMFGAAFVYLSFFGRYIDFTAAVLAGMGFGMLVNEMGIFIAMSSNSLFEAVIPEVYYIFILCFFAVRYLLFSRRCSMNDYLVNSLEVIQDDFVTEKYKESYVPVEFLLKKVGFKNPVVRHLHHLVHSHLDAAPAKGKSNALLEKIDKMYPAAAGKNMYKFLLAGFFAAFSVFNAYYFLVPYMDGFSWDLSVYSPLEIMELLTAVLIIFLALGGIRELFLIRMQSYKMLELLVYLSIFLEQVFIFDGDRTIGTIGLVWSFIALFKIKYLMHLEEHHMHLHVLGRDNPGEFEKPVLQKKVQQQKQPAAKPGSKKLPKT